VTNTGNVTLTNVLPSEGTFSGTGTKPVVVCPGGAATLVPGQTLTCTATYTVTQADLDSGATIANGATATGTPPASYTGPAFAGSATDPATSPAANVSVTQAAAMTLKKTADIALVSTVGQVITYSFLITNTGNVTLINVKPVEGDFGGAGDAPVITCPSAAVSLAPGDSVTCTAPYTVVAADIAATHQISNTATATGFAPASDLALAPVAAASTASVTAQKILAFTGDDGNSIVLTALALLLAGGMLWLIAMLRRRRPQPRH
jgi:hypothetical protein